MQIKALTAVLALTSTALSLPTTNNKRAIDPELQNVKYTIMALRSASPVHFLSVNAIAGRLYLGGETTSYCPPGTCGCPPGNVTVFDGACALSAMNPDYPSGQTLWNTDDGTIGYDFSQVRPDSTYNCPWYLATSENDAFAATIAATYGADGFVACPTAQTGTWQLLRSVAADKLAAPHGDASKCLGVSLEAISYNATEYGAWQYS